MKLLRFRIFLSVLSLVLTCSDAMAQERVDSVDKDSHIIYISVGEKMNLKDKVIIQNRSPYYLLQVAVTIVCPDGQFEPVGGTAYLAPGEERDIASYRDNMLRQLCGQTLAIKVKGTSRTFAKEGAHKRREGFDGLYLKSLTEEDVASICPDEVTYNFNASLFVARHDLYIKLFHIDGTDGTSIMDF